MDIPPVIDVPNFLENITIEQVLGVLIFILALIVVFRKFKPYMDGLKNFLDDWSGTPARPGVEARPGVIERLSKLESSQASSTETLNQIKGQVFPDSGQSLFDKVNKIKTAVGAEND